MPGGDENSSANFGSVGYLGSWWSVTDIENIAIRTYNRIMYYLEEFGGDDDYIWYVLFSVRCVKD
jgi:hypothetical protein